jgi:hypothetical protein
MAMTTIRTIPLAMSFSQHSLWYTKQSSHGSDYNPYKTIGNEPPPTFDAQVTMCDRDEEEFQR